MASPWGCIFILTPDQCRILSCAGGKPQWGYFYRAFQGYKTGRRGSRIVKVTQSAAKVVTGVSVSLSWAERGTRLRCGLLNIYSMSHERRHEVCSIKWYGTPTSSLQSSRTIQLSKWDVLVVCAADAEFGYGLKWSMENVFNHEGVYVFIRWDR